MAKVLVVDDEMVVCKSIQKILNREGHTVEYTLNAQEAMERMEKETFDVIITDLMMPKISGMRLLATTKERWPEINVIMITGYATVKSAVLALKLGAFDYIPKPFTPDELSIVTARALERKRLGQEDKVISKNPVPTNPGPITPPKDLYYIPEHAWVRMDGDQAIIGIDFMFQRTVGEIVSVELSHEGNRLDQGKVCVRLTGSNKKIFLLWSPLSGEVVGVNYDLVQDCSPLSTDPYGKGWLIRLKPTNLNEELENLSPRTRS